VGATGWGGAVLAVAGLAAGVAAHAARPSGAAAASAGDLPTGWALQLAAALADLGLVAAALVAASSLARGRLDVVVVLLASLGAAQLRRHAVPALPPAPRQALAWLLDVVQAPSLLALTRAQSLRPADVAHAAAWTLVALAAAAAVVSRRQAGRRG
jgi:hypothetical protein